MRLSQQPRQMDIKKSRDMTQIEQTNVSQVDRFFEKHRRGDHSESDEIPGGPPKQTDIDSLEPSS